ncbi:HA1F protein, partial [Nothoprocta pentlandii]|nr:HA1F protein [Nothoprocta pentlandii]
LRDGAAQDMETRRSSVAPNGDGTYHAWATIEVLPEHRAQYVCRVEHASLAEPGFYSWEPESGLMPAVIGAVVAVLLVTAVIVGIVVWKKFATRKAVKGYRVAAGEWQPRGR